jgi:hypothetical protein
MKEQFVDHEIAVLLKEKGFKGECMAYYEISIKAKKDEHDGFSGPFGWKKGEVNFSKGYFENSGLPDNSNEYWLLCGAPLWQQAIDWFREKHSIDIMVRQIQLDGRAYYKITKIETEDRIKGYSNFCKSTYEAREKAIKHALTLI